MTVTITAAGPTILIFVLNLSAIVTPWVLVAAIVVSEMNERLSPKNAPPTMMAVMKAGLATIPEHPPVPSSSAIPAATGTRATIVPTLVPIDIEMKQAARKRPANSSFPGNILRARLTVASIAPISLAVVAKAPANTNIHIIRSTFLFPAPSENIAILCSNVFPLQMRMAYIDASRNAADMGIL